MKRVQFIEHKGRQILHIDVSGCRAAEVEAVVEEAKKVIAAQPLNSVRILTNVTSTEMSRQTSAMMKSFTAHNKPYVAHSAVVGLAGLQKIVYDAVIMFTGREIVTFEKVEQAKDWLASQ